MKSLIYIFSAFLFIQNSLAGDVLKVEGTCSGAFPDGSAVALTYYSDFDGCKVVSAAAVNFTAGIEGLHTGKREFVQKQDLYTFTEYKLSFLNSTGNTSGKLTYPDFESGKSTTITLQCDVRDYEYADC